MFDGLSIYHSRPGHEFLIPGKPLKKQHVKGGLWFFPFESFFARTHVVIWAVPSPGATGHNEG